MSYHDDKPNKGNKAGGTEAAKPPARILIPLPLISLRLLVDRNALAERHIRLAYREAGRAANRYGTATRHLLEYADALSEAFTCLLRCAELFDATLGYAFTTYYVRSYRWIMRRVVNDKVRKRERETQAAIAAWKASGKKTRWNRGSNPSRVDTDAGVDVTTTIACDGRSLARRFADQDLLETALGGLSSTDREVIVERVQNGRTFGEIAKQKGCSHQNASQVFWRAFKRLREQVEKLEKAG